jgi:hypothetical protein
MDLMTRPSMHRVAFEPDIFRVLGLWVVVFVASGRPSPVHIHIPDIINLFPASDYSGLV